MKIILVYVSFIFFMTLSCAKGTVDVRTPESTEIKSTLNATRLPLLWDPSLTVGHGSLKYVGTIAEHTDYYRDYKFDSDSGKDYNNGFVFSGTSFNHKITVYQYDELPRNGAGQVDESKLCDEEKAGSLIREHVSTLGQESKFYARLDEGDFYLAFKDEDGEAGNCNYITKKIQYRYRRVSSNIRAFAIMKEDKVVATFGDAYSGGNRSIAIYGKGLDGLDDDKQPISIISSEKAFTVLHRDGSLTTWYNKATVKGTGEEGGVTKAFSQATYTIDGEVTEIHLGEPSAEIVALFANKNAYVALRENGTIVNWGVSDYGGSYQQDGVLHPASAFNRTSDGSTIIPGNKVVAVIPNDKSFTVIKADGSIATWGGVKGDIDEAGSNYVLTQYPANTLPVTADFPLEGFTGKRVVNVVPSEKAFVAQTEDGGLVSWGDSQYGGSFETHYPAGTLSSFTGNSAIPLHNVVGNTKAFAAINKSGTIASWGHAAFGGNLTVNIPENSAQQWKYTKVFPGYQSFTALSTNGLLTSWGDIPTAYSEGSKIFKSGNLSQFTPSRSGYNLTSPHVAARWVIPSSSANLALLSNGLVIAWGNIAQGGSIAKCYPKDGFVSVGSSDENSMWQIYSNWDAFAAVKVNGELVTWGKVNFDKDVDEQGKPTKAQGTSASGRWDQVEPADQKDKLFTGSSEIEKIYSTSFAFLALKKDGSFMVWGDPQAGGSAKTHFPQGALSNYKIK